jgi:phosphoglycerate kinase
MAKLSVRDLDLKGKRVLVRVDFNVPLKDGKVADDTRIKASLPTLQYILEQGGKAVLVSHLGRPDGKPNEKYSLKPVAGRLQELLGKPVDFGEPKGGAVTLLENVRFDAGEEKNDDALAKKLAAYGDVYVNDAFGTAHRAHASTAGVTKYFKQSACGFLIEKEIKYLGQVLTNPDKPFVAIMGGSKVSDKILILEQLSKKVDAIIVGGGMAYTLLKAQGKAVGNSKVEADKLDLARKILASSRIILPVDHVAADKFDAAARTQVVTDVPDGDRGRRRHGGGGREVRCGRQDVPRVHRRRRLPRIPRGQGTPRHRGPHRQVDPLQNRPSILLSPIPLMSNELRLNKTDGLFCRGDAIMGPG